jgi:hypothetical protein
MNILRRILCAAVVLIAYVAALIAITWPWAGAAMGILAIAALGRKGQQLSAHGTARWCDASDIPHMIDGGDK